MWFEMKLGIAHARLEDEVQSSIKVWISPIRLGINETKKPFPNWLKEQLSFCVAGN